MIRTKPFCSIRPGLLAVAVLALLGNLNAADETSSYSNENDKVVLDLEPFEVLGSRIRLTEVTGSSPVNVFGKEQIAQTGAMTLSDFLNRLPQNSNGVSTGQGYHVEWLSSEGSPVSLYRFPDDLHL